MAFRQTEAKKGKPEQNNYFQTQSNGYFFSDRSHHINLKDRIRQQKNVCKSAVFNTLYRTFQ